MKKMLLSRKDLLEYLGISRNTLNDIIAKDPSFPGKKTRTKYSLVQIDQWLTAETTYPHQKETDPEPGPLSKSFMNYLDKQN